jgi:hypothetical protein
VADSRAQRPGDGDPEVLRLPLIGHRPVSGLPNGPFLHRECGIPPSPAAPPVQFRSVRVLHQLSSSAFFDEATANLLNSERFPALRGQARFSEDVDCESGAESHPVLSAWRN